MENRRFELEEICISVPTVSHDLSLKELKKVFEELKIYEYLTVMKDKKPIGIVYRKDLVRATKQNLTAGDFSKIAIRLRNFSPEKESLIGIIELLPVIREPIIVVDKRGNYLGVLTYEVLLHYITKFKEHIIPLVQHLREAFSTENFLYVFGIKNLKKFKEKYGEEKTKGLLKILKEDIQESFKGELEEYEENQELWLLTSECPEKEKLKELYDEFFKEYTLLFGDIPDVSLYGFALSLKPINDYDELYKKIKELRDRALRITGYVFIVYGIQPKLFLFDPRKKKLLKNIKEKILEDFRKIVEEIENTPQDLWEFTLYDLFKKYPYFELFYIISESGLQISNNVINPSVQYFVAQGKKGTDRSDRPYYSETLEKGEYISDIYLSKATDDFCLTVAKLFEYNGKRYILAGDINFKEIHKLVKSMSQEEVKS